MFVIVGWTSLDGWPSVWSDEIYRTRDDAARAALEAEAESARIGDFLRCEPRELTGVTG